MAKESYKPQVVYVALIKDGKVKIGITSYPQRRKTELENQSGFTIERFFNSDPYSNACKIETAIHETFYNQRIKGEWFSCDFDDAVEEIKKQSNLIGETKEEKENLHPTVFWLDLISDLQNDVFVLTEKLNMTNEACNDMVEWIQCYEFNISKLLSMLGDVEKEDEKRRGFLHNTKTKLTGVRHSSESFKMCNEYGIEELKTLEVYYDKEGIQKLEHKNLTDLYGSYRWGDLRRK